MKSCTIRSYPIGKTFLIFPLIVLFTFRSAAQCGFDFYIANDQSGSVDSKENFQSRQFIERLAIFYPLGNANTENRIAIASWSATNEFQQFSFPSAGSGYTTSLSDIVTYRNSTQLFKNTTDPYNALLRSWQNRTLTPVSGRTVRKVIVLMTDANSFQINPSIISLASTIKATGTYIIVLGIDEASTAAVQATLQLVASPGGNFSAPSYQDLIENSLATVQAMNNQICPGMPPAFDLGVAINSYDCNTGQVNYTVYNIGNITFGPATLSVSFYAGDPHTVSAVLLATHTQNSISLAGNSSGSYTFANSRLNGLQNLFAVVNLSTTGTNAFPPLPYDLSDRLVITGEGNTVNNVSAPYTTTACGQAALLHVSNSGNMGCNNIATYQVQVANVGSAAADIQTLSPLPPAGFALQYGQISYNPAGCSTLVPSTQRTWGTYFGGDNIDGLYDMAVDASGNIYITGQTESNSNIATNGSVFHKNLTPNGGYDGFVAKFDASGVLQWGTYFGGTANDMGQSIAIDANGDVYVAGTTASGAGIASAGRFQTSLRGLQDAFLMKFNGATGSRAWGTYYGDSSTVANETVAMVTVSGTFVYLAMSSNGAAGATASNGTNNLVTNSTVHGGGMDIILAKFNATGTRQWATLFGGDGDENIDKMTYSYGDMVANSTSVFLGGTTTSSSGVASSSGAWDNTYANVKSGILTRFNPADGSVYWSTYIDGVGTTQKGVTSIIFDGPNRILVGETGRVERFSDTGGPPVFTSTVIYSGSLARDASGNIYTAYYTSNVGSPVTSTAYQPANSGGFDVYFVMYNSNLQLQYASYFGDAVDEFLRGHLIIDAAGNLIFGGTVAASPATLGIIATPGAHKTAVTSIAASTSEGFIEKFAPFKYKGLLSPGCSLMLNYAYDASSVTNGTYQSSFGVTAAKALSANGNPVTIFDNNFTVPNYAGMYNGFNGAVNSSDDVIKTSLPCTLAASPITIAVSFGGPAVCSRSFGTATVTIVNPNSTAITNANLQLKLTGTSSSYSGEPYNLTNGLRLQTPDLSSSDYPLPGVTGQLNARSGNQVLDIYLLPPGTSSFQIDVSLGTVATNLAATVTNLSTIYFPSGATNTATGGGFPASIGIPLVNISCTGSINAGSPVTLTGSVSGAATSIQWSSPSNDNIPYGGTLSSSSINYLPSSAEVAAGIVEISLRAVNTSGCDDGVSCRVIINNVQRDFGDAPSSFDLGQAQLPVAAGSTPLNGLCLGKVPPDTETGAQASITCMGDGPDEDGLKSYDIPHAGQAGWQMNVQVTNDAAKIGYLTAFVDWNHDGDFLDSNETSTLISIPASAGTKLYTPAFDIPAVIPPDTYMRLRLSTDQQEVALSYGSSPEGEVEDYVVFLTLPLHVNYLDFNAKKAGNGVLLSWQTAMEISHDRFDVERSQSSAGTWQKIGEITDPNNNSTQLKSYSLTDYNPYSGINYYRLRQVDADGKSTNSVVRTIDFGSGEVIQLYPNPVKDHMFLSVSDRNSRHDVYVADVSGAQILQAKDLTDGAFVSMATLPAGIYVVRVTDNDKLIKYYKICKQ